MRFIQIRACLLGLSVSLASFAWGQSYPTHPIHLIVQYPAGGAIDVLGRNIAQRPGAELGQPFVIDNKPGASGFLAFDACAKAAPDGYTVCLATGESVSCC